MKCRPRLLAVATAAVLAVTPAGPAGAQSGRGHNPFDLPPAVAASPEDAAARAQHYRGLLGLDAEEATASPADATNPRPPSRLPGRFYVLAVGISDYGDPAQNLRSPAKNARDVAELFRRQAPDSAVRLLLDQDATAENFRGALKAIECEARPGDFVVVFLCGHGYRESGDWRFCCRDSPVAGSSLASPLRTLVDRGQTVMLAIDSCHAGQLARDPEFRSGRMLDNLGPDGRPVPGGFIFLAGCHPSELGWDGEENGRFTTALLEALRGRSDVDRDGLVTVKEVRTFLTWRMDELVHRFPKLPGLAWPEQISLTMASVDESAAITRSERVDPLRPGDGWSPAPWMRWPWVQCQASSLAGVWQASQPGETYTLTLSENSSYEAVHRVRGTVDRTSGTYRYRPAGGPFVGLPVEAGRRRLVDHGVFELEYDNGVDRLGIEASGDDWLSVVVYPSPSFQAGARLELRRVRGAVTGAVVGEVRP